uniref:Putative cytochrome n=1 Tax=Ixodes ricinus TaxID=34613 RepID=A0A090XB67_IXORI
MKALFYLLLLLAEVLLFGTITLTIYWIFNYQGGVAWANDTRKQFNLHYILMVGGFIFLNGHATVSVPQLHVLQEDLQQGAAHHLLRAVHLGHHHRHRVRLPGAQQRGRPQALLFPPLVDRPRHHGPLRSSVCSGLHFYSWCVLCCDKATVTYRQRLVPDPTVPTLDLIIFGIGRRNLCHGSHADGHL